jgi:hypothetical protein
MVRQVLLVVLGVILSASVGLILWSVAFANAGGREAIDAPDFWTLYWPLAVALSFAIGMLLPLGSFLWGFILMAMLWVVMGRTGSGMSLWPIALIFLVFQSIPPGLAGLAGGLLRYRIDRRR